MGLFNKQNKETMNTENIVLENEKEMGKDTQPTKNEKTLASEVKSSILNADKIEIPSEHFGKLLPYIKDESVTDIDFNGRDLWIGYDNGRREKKNDIGLNPVFYENLTKRLSITDRNEFNQANPKLESEVITDGISLRITAAHNAATATGLALCIRKTPTYAKITTDAALRNGYATPEMLAFLFNCIKAHMNIIVCGEPGVGKTELAKYLALSITDKERVITIEDTLEWHYSSIKPESDSIELKVSDQISYTDAIKLSLRLNPIWMMISEVRGVEAKAFIQALTTGVKGITSIHADDVLNIPTRIQSMTQEDGLSAEKTVDDVYTFCDVGILLEKRQQPDGSVIRQITQIAMFDFDNNRRNHNIMFAGKEKVEVILPESKRRRFEKYGISDIYENENIPLKRIVKEA